MGLVGDGTTFPALLTLLTRAAPLLSASPTVRFEPPAVVVRLASKESELLAHHERGGNAGAGRDVNGNGNERKRRLRGDERVGLGSVLGWDAGAGEAREARARGRGMVGARGFARMQELSVLVRGMCRALAPRKAVEEEARAGRERER
jgi:1-phosphatidylinositol-3-phosphate 5-kinase